MSVDLKAVVLLLALSAAGIGGFFAFEAVGATASQGTTGAYVPMTTTVHKLVRVLEHGRVVVKRVPVVKRILAKPVTVQETRTIQTPSGPRVVTRNVVHYETVYRKKVITVHGKSVTVNQIVTNTHADRHPIAHGYERAHRRPDRRSTGDERAHGDGQPDGRQRADCDPPACNSPAADGDRDDTRRHGDGDDAGGYRHGHGDDEALIRTV